MRLMLTIALAIALSGCITQPKVESTKAWEVHYLTKEAAKAAAESITLENNESIWILSN